MQYSHGMFKISHCTNTSYQMTLPDSSYIESTRKQAMDDYIITVNTSK